jgi:uncharacterized protein
VTRCEVFNLTRNVRVVSDLEVAENGWARMKGLLGRSAEDFPPGRGLWIPTSGGIHTIGMRFPIDAAYLDSRGKVVRLHNGLRPFRIGAIAWSTRVVLELPPGTLRRTGTRIGDVLERRAGEFSGV